MKLIKTKRYKELISREEELIRTVRRLQCVEAELKKWTDGANGECVEGPHCVACCFYHETSRFGYINGKAITRGVCTRRVPCPAFLERGCEHEQQS